MSSAVSSAVEKQLSAYLPGSSKEEHHQKDADVTDVPNPILKGNTGLVDHSTVAKDRGYATPSKDHATTPSKDHATAPGRFLTKAR